MQVYLLNQRPGRAKRPPSDDCYNSFWINIQRLRTMRIKTCIPLNISALRTRCLATAVFTYYSNSPSKNIKVHNYLADASAHNSNGISFSQTAALRHTPALAARISNVRLWTVRATTAQTWNEIKPRTYWVKEHTLLPHIMLFTVYMSGPPRPYERCCLLSYI